MFKSFAVCTVRADAQTHAHGVPLGLSGGPRILEVIEEEVFEHERFVPLRGWSSSNLVPGERQRFVAGRTGSGPPVASATSTQGMADGMTQQGAHDYAAPGKQSTCCIAHTVQARMQAGVWRQHCKASAHRSFRIVNGSG